MAILFRTSIPSPLPRSGNPSPVPRITKSNTGAPSMIYSYTQIANYLRCPRSYRYRYLDGWREKDTRAALIFGRCFEKALEATSVGRIAGPRYTESGACTERQG